MGKQSDIPIAAVLIACQKPSEYLPRGSTRIKKTVHIMILLLFYFFLYILAQRVSIEVNVYVESLNRFSVIFFFFYFFLLFEVESVLLISRKRDGFFINIHIECAHATVSIMCVSVFEYRGNAFVCIYNEMCLFNFILI